MCVKPLRLASPFEAHGIGGQLGQYDALVRTAPVDIEYRQRAITTQNITILLGGQFSW